MDKHSRPTPDLCFGDGAGFGRVPIIPTLRKLSDVVSHTLNTLMNALAKAGVEFGENGSVIPRPKGKR